ncbi:copper-translocating P-type ATPase [Idiomarina tyrosinivorans]|uniref:Copper-translocating P-type ATPase n=1 Tax=Idiomarina tyrosinivorans TaxID=1445662 RepID=A0A432ZU06_9GAMM|nr:heavy metal translocating P-type ATPase [Idiomarina tyrosinivorans]RUO81322.1 copper-translocating P-type ATPase [Idiomarina tyrosinivorans]
MGSDAERCFHCRQPIPHNVQLSVAYHGEDKPVCCYGCQAVAETIIGSGMDNFYQYRDDDALFNTPLIPEGLTDFSLYDHPQLQHDFVSQQGAVQQIALSVDDITCAACAWLIERQLGSLPGVKDVVVNVSHRRITVRWDKQQASLSAILNALLKIGYRAFPFRPDQQEQRLKQQKLSLIKRLGVAGIASMQVMMGAVGLYFGVVSDLDSTARSFLWFISLLFATPVILYSATPFYWSALRSLQAGRANMDVPVSIALLGAYIASAYAAFSRHGEVYFESISMFTFFLLAGRYLEVLAKDKATQAASNRMTVVPELATRELADGGTESVAVRQLQPGDIIYVTPGATLAADGVLLSKTGAFDESLLTGESQARLKLEGDDVIAGSINQQQPIRVKVTATQQNTVLAGLVALQDMALADKPKGQKTVDKVAQYFVLALLLLAGVTYLIWWWIQPDHALWVTLSVLVATCPCALSLAAPTAVTGVIHRLNRLGVLVKKMGLIDTAAKLTTIVFDKTGTLTRGEFRITDRNDFADEVNNNAIIANLEAQSEHPIGRFLHSLSDQQLQVVDRENHPGAGVAGTINGVTYRLGRPDWIKQWHPHWQPTIETQVVLATSSEVLTELQLADTPRKDAASTIKELQRQGIRCVMLTGDQQSAAERTAKELGITEVFANCLPQEKLQWLALQQQQGQCVWMVGDGLNDGPVLAQADASITFAEASDLARNAADTLVLKGRLSAILDILSSVRKARSIMQQNFIWATGYNLAILPLAMMGMVAPWAAAIGMSLSSLLVIVNALRLYKL